MTHPHPWPARLARLRQGLAAGYAALVVASVVWPVRSDERWLGREVAERFHYQADVAGLRVAVQSARYHHHGAAVARLLADNSAARLDGPALLAATERPAILQALAGTEGCFRRRHPDPAP